MPINYSLRQLHSMKSIFLGLFLLAPAFFIGQIFLQEDFESSTFPSEWSQSSNADDGGFLLGTAEDLESEWWPIANHGNILATNDDACDCDKSVDYLIMPPFNFTDAGEIILQFQNYFDGGSLFGGTEEATIEYSLDDGYSWTVLEEIAGTEDEAWDAQTIDLSSLAGEADVLVAFHYYDDGEWLFGWGLDDVVVFSPEGLDAALVSLSIGTNLDAPSVNPIEGTVLNTGLDEITSFDVNWTIGGDVFTENFSGLSIASLESYDFEHPDQLSIESSGQLILTVWISNVNGGDDDNAENDEIVLEIQSLEYGELEDDGLLREYIYYHPATAPPNCALVFVCHGYTGTAQGIMGYSDFNQVADEHGFAVCYPQGIEDSFGSTFFNVGYDFQNNETVDDVAYVTNLAAHLQENNSLDPEKVFCTGLSNGGDFCYMLACQASETFMAVAPVAGMILQDIMDDCNPANPMPVFEIHGTNDNVTYYEGDPNNDDDWGAYPDLPSTIDFFIELNGLDQISTENLPNIDTNDGSTVTAQIATSDSSPNEVWFYTVNGGGHDWPGAWGNMDIDASQEVWAFFEKVCENATSIETFGEGDQNKELVKIVDLLGRETPEVPNTLLIYIYSDGTSEKKVLGE